MADDAIAEDKRLYIGGLLSAASSALYGTFVRRMDQAFSDFFEME
jgi:hypothetical protein